MQSEEQFFASQSADLTSTIETFGSAVATIMAIGAVFAALNTMYTAVVTRTVEIATLRALGFGGLPVVISVMIESLTLALLGGVLGAAVAYLVFDGFTASTLNNVSFSQVAFDFAVTPELIRDGVTWAVLLGAVGGLFPRDPCPPDCRSRWRCAASSVRAMRRKRASQHAGGKPRSVYACGQNVAERAVEHRVRRRTGEQLQTVFAVGADDD